MNLLIAAITEGLEFDGGTIYQEALGGSESAFVFMMRELAKRGHEVHAFTKCPNPGSYDGVGYHRIQEFNDLSPMFEWDLLFAYRHVSWLTRPNHAKLRILVNHDILVPESKTAFMGSLWQTDLLFNLSEYHKRQYCDLIPRLEEHIWATSNGVDLPAIDKAIKGVHKDNNKFVYGSRPERGLDVLLRDIWPKLYEADSERRLHLAGYDGSKGLELPQDILSLYAYIDELIEKTPGIVKEGCLKKEDWYKLLASSGVYLYSSAFPEIFFINGAESQACGTPVICTDDFACKETVASGFCRVTGKNTSLEYQEEFIRRVEELSRNDLFYHRVQREGREHVEKNYPWEKVAASWEEKILSYFEERFQKNKCWVFRQLIYNSDILAAKELAAQENMPEELAEAQAVLERATTYKDDYAADDPSVLTTVSSDLTNLGRVPVIAPYLKGVKTLLEVGCHYAEHSIGFSNLYPELQVLATDFSPACIEQAMKFRETVPRYPENVALRIASWENALLPNEPRVDAVFAGEILEHVPDPYAFIEKMETYVKPGGIIIYTLPSGPWESDSLQCRDRFSQEENRFHISDFRFRDIGEVFSRKKDFTFSYCPNGITGRGELVGNWVMAYRADASPTGRVDLRRKFLTTRPYPGVSACLIVGNEESDIRRCLKSIKDIVDEIIIVGTPACEDRTLEIAAEFTGRLFITTSDPPDRDPSIIQQTAPGDFGWWRNESIKPARYPWILWLDADEILTGGQGLKKYLSGTIFNGFVIRQHHLTIDIPPGKLVPDVPVRVFRNFKGYEASGIIHEHFQESLNVPIDPAFQLEDVNLAHFGYITEAMRREKCYHRNLKLLMKDRIVYPERTLGLILLQRDYLNFVSLHLEETQGKFDARIVQWLQSICAIHRVKFQDKENIYYRLSYALYQQALRWLGEAGVPVEECTTPPFEVGLWLGGGIGGLNAGEGEAVHPSRRWFADAQEYREYITEFQERLAGLLRLDVND